MAFFKIGNTDLSGMVNELSVVVSNLDSENSGRNANGKMMRDRIRGGSSALRKISVKCRPLKNNEIGQIMSALSDTAFIDVTYPDPYTGTTRKGKFYPSDRTAPVYSAIDGKFLWSGLSFNLIEE
ncbi:MAG: hypothetical protein IJ736_06245 [Firmicutes bacterium]|nr:hypothetical protein [Bacillota bacterium]